MMSNDSSKKETYVKALANRFIEDIAHFRAPWQRDWASGEIMAPFNPANQETYQGINALNLLSKFAEEPRWMSYDQALSLGAQVKKGSKGTTIQSWQFEETNFVIDGEGQRQKITDKRERPNLILSTVFNAEQIENLPSLQKTVDQSELAQRANASAAAILKNSGAQIEHHQAAGGDYDPKTDKITLPDERLHDNQSFYHRTALYALLHWTGHESRLNRDLSHPIGSNGHVKEVFRVGMANFMLCQRLGFNYDGQTQPQNEKALIQILKDDPFEILRAAKDAEDMVTFVLGLEKEIKQKVSRENSPVSEAAAQDKTMENSKQPALYLQVPFNEKDEAKALGARWDRQQRAWYVPQDKEPSLFQKWSPSNDQLPPKTESPTVEPVKKTTDIVFLKVPFEEKDEARARGAKWNPEAKSWFVAKNDDLSLFSAWMPDTKTDSPTLSAAEELKSVLLEMGAHPHIDMPLLDSKSHRLKTVDDKPNQSSIFYVAHNDGVPAGYIKNHRTGEEKKWFSKGYHISSEDYQAQKQALVEKKQAQLQERKALQEEVAKELGAKMNQWPSKKIVTPYLAVKGLEAQRGIFVDEKEVTHIPLFDVNGKLWNRQTITAEGQKLYEKSARKEGCFHLVGIEPNKVKAALSKASIFIVSEGYATAASVSMATKAPTIAAMDAGNLISVAKALREQYPDKPIIIAADNDHLTEQRTGKNPGLLAAQTAAKAVDGLVCAPMFLKNERGSDFNDLANTQQAGLKSVKRHLEPALYQAKAWHKSQAKVVKKSADMAYEG